jgi:hypothetical protein
LPCAWTSLPDGAPGVLEDNAPGMSSALGVVHWCLVTFASSCRAATQWPGCRLCSLTSAALTNLSSSKTLQRFDQLVELPVMNFRTSPGKTTPAPHLPVTVTHGAQVCHTFSQAQALRPLTLSLQAVLPVRSQAPRRRQAPAGGFGVAKQKSRRGGSDS